MMKNVNVSNNFGNINIGVSQEYDIKSGINLLLNLLAKNVDEYKFIKRKPTPNTIKKIEYNNIQSKRHIIKQYLDHSAKIESALKEIDSLKPFAKTAIFDNLNGLYYSALDHLKIDYLLEDISIEKIRLNSDFILNYIIQELKRISYESNNRPELKEIIELGINVVVAYAFIECIILENPNL